MQFSRLFFYHLENKIAVRIFNGHLDLKKVNTPFSRLNKYYENQCHNNDREYREKVILFWQIVQRDVQVSGIQSP